MCDEEPPLSPPLSPPSLASWSVEVSPNSNDSNLAHHESVPVSPGRSTESSTSKRSPPHLFSLKNWMENSMGNLDQLACDDKPQSLIDHQIECEEIMDIFDHEASQLRSRRNKERFSKIMYKKTHSEQEWYDHVAFASRSAGRANQLNQLDPVPTDERNMSDQGNPVEPLAELVLSNRPSQLHETSSVPAQGYNSKLSIKEPESQDVSNERFAATAESTAKSITGTKSSVVNLVQPDKESHINDVLLHVNDYQTAVFPARIPLPGERTFCRFTGHETNIPQSRRSRRQRRQTADKKPSRAPHRRQGIPRSPSRALTSHDNLPAGDMQSGGLSNDEVEDVEMQRHSSEMLTLPQLPIESSSRNQQPQALSRWPPQFPSLMGNIRGPSYNDESSSALMPIYGADFSNQYISPYATVTLTFPTQPVDYGVQDPLGPPAFARTAPLLRPLQVHESRQPMPTFSSMMNSSSGFLNEIPPSFSNDMVDRWMLARPRLEETDQGQNVALSATEYDRLQPPLTIPADFQIPGNLQNRANLEAGLEVNPNLLPNNLAALTIPEMMPTSNAWPLGSLDEENHSWNFDDFL